ncbi:Flagellum-specific peptidoglycan hydrolase FlgJ [Chitinophaga sp. YR627]|uniref:glucosaminidase domain-containing protein n=1 Tax=Chitinophaga sp. YR627 TaxID=1881041 RepID=UPI0008EBC498|nr:glucosaminidase domain-containing protein [Chitinophaga sp. YR627]SFN96977.1 Flagellum-specific peptidoglycan hydrolase FlgJ [Chitinophaga sp. YR627]
MTSKKMFSRGWFCAMLGILLLIGNSAFSQRSVTNYVKKYKPTAVRIMNETGIPASVIMGVAMLESGMGTSKNAKYLHNHFGIVGRNTLHKQKGVAYRSRYKEFASAEASFDYFANMVKKKKWFSSLKGNTEYKLWLKHMNHAGYSSAGHEWVKRVTSMISRYKLYKLDEQMAYTGS